MINAFTFMMKFMMTVYETEEVEEEETSVWGFDRRDVTSLTDVYRRT